MKKYFAYIITTLLLLASCKKDHSIILTTQEFPSSVGSWWEYEMSYNNSNIHDTAIITILDTIMLSGYTWQRWVQNQFGPDFSNWTDTIYVYTTNNSFEFYLTYYGPPSSQPPPWTFNFPIIDNEPWGPPIGLVSYTTKVQNITAGGVSYNNLAYLSKTTNSGAPQDVNSYESFWIQKNVGIVEHDFDYPFQNKYTHYSMISFHIN